MFWLCVCVCLGVRMCVYVGTLPRVMLIKCDHMSPQRRKDGSRPVHIHTVPLSLSLSISLSLSLFPPLTPYPTHAYTHTCFMCSQCFDSLWFLELFRTFLEINLVWIKLYGNKEQKCSFRGQQSYYSF